MSKILRRWINYYSLFPKTLAAGPPPKGPFEIDTKSLRNEYLKAQQQAHPDVNSGATAADSATLGSAYRTLLDPLLRSRHILELQGSTAVGEDASLDDEELLMNILMVREEVSECEDPAERAKLEQANNERIESTIHKISQAYSENDLETAQKATIELGYWIKLRAAFHGED
ncbi:J-type co-chaperone jac1, mitochondrial [Wickerhamiella sorbophila]|uniref:J-type co-chaperone jac1, mitochondrial n=1 Tax=Wickerhamiella sorbophila TaxID=45607 RepID=A0A2T0FMA9_9ASCO|nr:J-type co-chaperone jac1, mitochondrial [Wickerhamiella sorbophila]PRT56107.1 J-type co-chaperone jac1, mitochondrial [Wickerhamiella sorbophila]